MKLKANLVDNNDTVVSVIIVTRNRPEKLAMCLRALLNSSLQNFELIIIDQSDIKSVHKKVSKYLGLFSKTVYVCSGDRGKSKGLNQALYIATSPILAFTDDDCIPDKNWINELYETFNKQPELGGVTGKTISYQPEKHKGLYCPATFKSDIPSPHLIKEAKNHWKSIGLGNNMAFRKSVFTEIGNFKEWLGPGSIGSNAEDADIFLRTLIAKKNIFYNPNVIIAHNRWLTKEQIKKQDFSYYCGEFACYLFYLLQGHQFAKKVLKRHKEIVWGELQEIVRSSVLLRFHFIPLSYRLLVNMFARLRGSLVAVFFYLNYVSTSQR